MKLKLVFRFLVILVITNLLVACSNPQGVEVPFTQWVEGALFGWGDGEPGNFGAIFSTLASAIGGPYGWAAGIIGTAVPAYVTARKKKQGIMGVVNGMQAARATLSEEQRLVFDNAARDVMNDAKGDPRQLVRNIKDKLRIAALNTGKPIIPSLSMKHQVKK